MKRQIQFDNFKMRVSIDTKGFFVESYQVFYTFMIYSVLQKLFKPPNMIQLTKLWYKLWEILAFEFSSLII